MIQDIHDMEGSLKLRVILFLCLFVKAYSETEDLSRSNSNLLRRLVQLRKEIENEKPNRGNNFRNRFLDTLLRSDDTGLVPGQTSEDGDPAEDEEKLERNSENGGQLLDQKNIDPDSILAKMVESMKVEINGTEMTPQGEHPDTDEKQREDSKDKHKYTPEQQALKRNFDSYTTLWEKGIVPYTIDAPLDNADSRKVIEDAIAELAKKTCIRLVPKGSSETQRLSHNSFVRFFQENGCWSYVGRVYDDQPISLGQGCVTHATVIHEILHALGMQHEQSRADRDKYIKIIEENIDEYGQGQFGKADTSDTRPYDAESVLQYNLYAFGKYDGNGYSKKTMEFIDKRLEFLADMDDGLDFYDVADITDSYHCTDHCTWKPICENGGFVDQNCACFCPNGLKGDNCEKVDTPDTCGGIVDITPSSTQTINSPNWPNSYPKGTKCTWLIRAPKGQKVTLRIDEMKLPYNYYNRCDHWLEIRYNLIGQLGPKRCGQDTNEIWTSASTGNPDLMLLRFDAKFAEDVPPLQGFTATASTSDNPCNNKGCENGGRCQNDPSGAVCVCKQGWQGPTCTEKVNNNNPCSRLDCKNDGVCQNAICVCKDGWQGTTCTEKIDPCSRLDCKNSGVCQNAECVCKDGWQGTTCTEKIENPCSKLYCGNGGVCEVGNHGDASCKCQGDWKGPTCDKSDKSTVLSKCTFEPNDPLCKFHMNLGYVDWTTHAGSTPTKGTGPDWAAEGNYYSYLEATGIGEGEYASMLYQFDNSNAGEECLSFYYHMMGNGMGYLSVYLVNYNNEYQVVWEKGGQNMGGQWNFAKIAVPAQTDKYAIDITASSGKNDKSDIAVDDVVLTSGKCS